MKPKNLLTKKDTMSILRKLSSKEYSEEYVCLLYGFSYEELQKFKQKKEILFNNDLSILENEIHTN